MDFRSAYRHVQQHRFAQSGVLGPLNIYSHGHWRLLLLFLRSFGASVHWACVDNKHWRSPCSAILLWKKAKLWLVGRRLQLAQQKFDDLLHSRRLPSTRGFTITVPQRCFIPAVKSALRLGVASQPSWDKMMRNYVVESIWIAVGKVRTFADKQNCAQLAQVFDWDEVRQWCGACHWRPACRNQLEGTYAIYARRWLVFGQAVFAWVVRCLSFAKSG